MISDQVTYWSLTLKSFCASWILSMDKKQQFGEDECKSCWENLFLATTLVEILDCYDVTNDSCLSQADICKVFQLSSHIINKRCA